MGLIEGLANITARIEADEAKYSNTDYVKAKWFKIEDKQAVTVTPLQELDKTNPAFSEKNGLGKMAVEHSNPANYRNKAVCSNDDEGRCVGCERHAKDPKAGWKQKTKLYINVLVEDGVNDPYVAILSSGMGKGSIAPALIEFLNDVEEGEEPPSLSKTKFRIKRSGKGLSDTSYTVMPKGVSKVNPEDHEVYDINAVLRMPTYGEQAEFYDRNVVQTEAAEQGELVGATSGNSTEPEEW